MLAHDLARNLDPTLVMGDAGLAPDPWQAELLRSEASRHLLLCSRQSGKSTVCGALALYTAIYCSGSLTLLISPSQRQSSELFRKVLSLLRALPGAPETAMESALRLEFKNNSRIIALPGSEQTIRGFSAASLIVIDEASRVEDALFTSVRPMLATTQGRFIAVTTPYGRRGWFYGAWTEGSGWERTRITAEECPRISSAWLEEERRLIGEWQFRQEYLCEFVDTEEQVFPSSIIEAAFDAEVEPLW